MLLSNKPTFSMMIVDDDHVTYDILKGLLSGPDYKMRKDTDYYFAKSEIEAAKIYETLYEMSRHPDIVLLTTCSQKINGYKVGKYLKKIDDSIYIVTINKDSDKETILRSKLVGAKGAIFKPVAAEDIIQQINIFLSEKSH